MTSSFTWVKVKLNVLLENSIKAREKKYYLKILSDGKVLEKYT